MLIVADNKTELINKINAADIKKWPLSVSILQGSKARSIMQNNLQHKHYAQIADFIGTSPVYAKAYCKIMYGVPILRSRDAGRCDYVNFDWLDSLVYESQIDAIMLVDVTSLFYVSEAMEYTKAMIIDFAQLGLGLTDPGDMLISHWESEIEKQKRVE